MTQNWNLLEFAFFYFFAFISLFGAYLYLMIKNFIFIIIETENAGYFLS